MPARNIIPQSWLNMVTMEIYSTFETAEENAMEPWVKQDRWLTPADVRRLNFAEQFKEVPRDFLIGSAEEFVDALGVILRHTTSAETRDLLQRLADVMAKREGNQDLAPAPEPANAGTFVDFFGASSGTGISRLPSANEEPR